MSGAGFESEGERRTANAGLRETSLFRHALGRLADLVMPPLCLACRVPLAAHDALCPSCWSGIAFIRPPLCDTLGLPMPFDTGGTIVSAAALADPPAYDRARAVGAYGGGLRDLVHALKFRDRHDLRALFGRWLVEAGRDLIADADVLVPVPLSRMRLVSRRFNQAAILAQEVGRRTGLTFEPLALERTRRTARQVGLTRRERAENVAGAFAVAKRRRGLVAGKRVLLIDDVITTGATVAACARTLKRAGALRVNVLAVALVTDAGHVPD